MKRKNILIILLIAILVTLGLVLYLNFFAKITITLNGEKDVTLNLLEEYEEKGAKAKYFKKDITDKIKITNNIDNTKVGEYKVTYKVKYKKKTASLQRTVNVVDTVAPEITLNGPSEVRVYLNSFYNEKGFYANDNYDGDITSLVKITGEIDFQTEGTYELVYRVSDSSNNEAEAKRTVIVEKRDANNIAKVPVLNYHFFYEQEGTCNEGNCISIYKFEDQLKYLKENGYTALTIEQFRAWMYGEIDIPDKSLLITIDDGAYGTGAQNGNYLIPMLEKYQTHATLFLITGWWARSNYVSDYLDVESHTNDMHTSNYCSGVQRGAKMLCLSHDEVIEDLKRSIDVTSSTTAFCYPFYAYNQTAIDELKEVGFKLAFAGGSYKATLDSNKYAIPRYQILRDISMERFIDIIS